MSILRTTALTTGATAARALLGTVAGFVVGAGLVKRWGQVRSRCGHCCRSPCWLRVSPHQLSRSPQVKPLSLYWSLSCSTSWIRSDGRSASCGSKTSPSVALPLSCAVSSWPAGAGAQIRRALAESFALGERDRGRDPASHRAISPKRGGLDPKGFRSRRGGGPAGRRFPAVPGRAWQQGGRIRELTAASNSASKVALAAAAIAKPHPTGRRQRVGRCSRATCGPRGCQSALVSGCQRIPGELRPGVTADQHAGCSGRCGQTLTLAAAEERRPGARGHGTRALVSRAASRQHDSVAIPACAAAGGDRH